MSSVLASLGFTPLPQSSASQSVVLRPVSASPENLFEVEIFKIPFLTSCITFGDGRGGRKQAIWVLARPPHILMHVQV